MSASNSTRFHYVYEIQNHCPGHEREGWRYRGMRSSKVSPELDIKYWGSSKPLKADIKALGREHFTKTVLEILPSRKAAIAAEARLVPSEWVLGETYNGVPGGNCFPAVGYCAVLDTVDGEFKYVHESVRLADSERYRYTTEGARQYRNAVRQQCPGSRRRRDPRRSA